MAVEAAKKQAQAIAAAHKRAADAAKNAAKEAAEAAEQAAARVRAAIEAVQKSVQSFAASATAALNQAKSSLESWVRSGVAASSTGQILAFHTEALSRTIAGLFRPEIEKAIELIRGLTNWIRSLSSEQKENIARWLMGAAVATTVVGIIPRMVSGIQAMAVGVKALTVALASSGWGAILPILGMAATALAGFGVATEIAEEGAIGFVNNLMDGLAGLKDPLTNLVEAFKPMLDIGAKVWATMQPMLIGLVEAAVKLTAGFMPVVTAILGPMVDLFGQLAEMTMPFIGLIVDLTTELAGSLAPILEEVGGLFSDLLSLMKPLIDWGFQLYKVFAEHVVEAMKMLGHWVKKILEWLRIGIAEVADVAGVALNKDKAKAKFDPKKPDKENNRNELAPRIGGFEGLGAAWDKIAQASLMATVGNVKPVEEKSLEELELARRQLEEIRKLLANMPPGVV